MLFILTFLSFIATWLWPGFFSMPSTNAATTPPPAIINNGNRQVRQVALTFDADMTPSMQLLLKQGKITSLYNEAVIKTLRDEHVPATIFLTGLWAKTYPQVAHDLAQDPLFEIGNHSEKHLAFTPHCFGLESLPTSGKEQDIATAQKDIAKITGLTPKYFRFPGGCYEPKDLKLLTKYGLTAVEWDISSTDAFNNNAQSIIKTVEQKVRPGSIIVFHLHGNRYAPQTNHALLPIIHYLKQQGYSFVTVSQLQK